MQASAETSAAIRSSGPKRFLRPRLPVWTRATLETTNRDRSFAAALDQTSDSHLWLCASKAEGSRSPHPDRWPGLCGNREVPSRDFPGSRRNWLLPRRRAALWGPLPLLVPRSVPARRFDLRSDRHPPSPASSVPRKDSNARQSDNLRSLRPELRPIAQDFGREGHDTQRWTAPVERLFEYSASRV